MKVIGLKNPSVSLEQYGLQHQANSYWNLSPAELTEHTVQRGLGQIADTGALVVDTGKFKGRAPKDKFTVKDAMTENTVDWNNFNHPTDRATFDNLYKKVMAYLADKDIWVRDAYACADPKYRLNIRVINEFPWGNMFCYNMFLRPTAEEFRPWTMTG